VARTIPDDNDVAVWLLNESSGTFVNSSTSLSTLGTDADLTTVTGSVNRNAVGLFMPPEDGALWIPGAYNFPAGASSSQNRVRTAEGLSSLAVALPFTISGWAKVRYPFNGFQSIVNKFYRADGTWNAPHVSWGIWAGVGVGGGSATDGSWQVFVTTSGTIQRLTMSAPSASMRHFARQAWDHVGITYDGTNLLAYLDGELAGTLPVTGAIDYGTNGAISFGCPYTTKQEANVVLQDWRLANVARPRSYFKEVYEAGFLRI